MLVSKSEALDLLASLKVKCLLQFEERPRESHAGSEISVSCHALWMLLGQCHWRSREKPIHVAAYIVGNAVPVESRGGIRSALGQVRLGYARVVQTVGDFLVAIEFDCFFDNVIFEFIPGQLERCTPDDILAF